LAHVVHGAGRRADSPRHRRRGGPGRPQRNFPDNYSTVVELAEARQLSLRIAYHLFPQTAGQEIDDLAGWIEMARPEDGDEWLRLNGAGQNLTWAAADFENFAQPRHSSPPTTRPISRRPCADHRHGTSGRARRRGRHHGRASPPGSDAAWSRPQS
jgi:hypothetical protein